MPLLHALPKGLWIFAWQDNCVMRLTASLFPIFRLPLLDLASLVDFRCYLVILLEFLLWYAPESGYIPYEEEPKIHGGIVLLDSVS